jgi:hypothetical protein
MNIDNDDDDNCQCCALGWTRHKKPGPKEQKCNSNYCSLDAPRPVETTSVNINTPKRSE